ncbi:helix-turn-helix transcriptional regulator [Cohnella luojiensis]|uniref:YafY family transcriptional regulator n=1 Tax=Cohnella luojiensis TaxID=652876 RepID=A0A4Y8LTI3_9BACL|nr:YafY family protein [Cohnella luojiensis]TFE23737.1 YafY family transcriptional regulator [Cohnella luojiensis]
MLKSQRLIRMIMMINAKKSFTVQELADDFGLSTRTITRDLQELSELGVPIYSVQGRGGGYRLLQERLLPPITFTESEAVAIFISCQSLKQLSALPFDDGAESALHKFYHYLPADSKEQIDRLKDRVAIISPQRSMNPECLRTLMQAIMVRSAATIEYRSVHLVEKRDIQPIGLYESDGYWYCPAYCFLREDYRLFRADRVLSASLNETIPCRDDVEQRTLWNAPPRKESEQVSFIIELAPGGVHTLQSDVWFSKFIHLHEDGSGTASLEIAAEKIPFYADMAWNLGEDAQVVAPLEAVEYIKRKIEALRLKYA